ncbi:MAG: alpha-1,4-glucan--maltose-1-phosphate maltosyltransferase [Candidatus Dormibacteraeota bacterium]|nr:alpha-1,4-glucan--maltose-1-phosphate maltosyltransferase [Candidatus Dormibacteraeota bacterium]
MRVPRAAGRVVIEGVRPTVDGGALPAKGAVGLPLRVSAVFIVDGHDRLLGWVRHGPSRTTAGTASGKLPSGWSELPMEPTDNDLYTSSVVPAEVGPWSFEVAAMPDDYGSWLRDLRLRFDDGQDVAVELQEGALMAEHRATRADVSATDKRELSALAHALLRRREPARLVAAAEAETAVALMRRTVNRGAATFAGPFPLWIDRELGAFSAWYELFPRSEGATPHHPGTLKTATARLPGVAQMGFDILYLPPIHPIGVTHRKGANNSLTPGPEDPGSPWAIGSAEGGHTAIHPDLGTIKDFDAFVAAARKAGIEVALDYALQSSPDHPWVTEHPQWFRHRPDGSIRYAENPPKRYQDIFPINFDTEDRDALWEALRDVMLFWISHGVRVFRVDNPHTKPIAFWEWLIAEVHANHPDVLFLAEAFTRPAMMRRLAKVGFTQSYTYFTWRNTKHELEEYLTQLSSTEMVDYYRPNFWVNTPDILHAFLQHGGPAAFRLRLVLAALTAPSWGMYSGYELYENLAVREGSEEYLNSEKFQVRIRDWNDPRSLAPMIEQVNGIRRRHREAIALLRTLRVHHIDSEHMLCVSRMSDDGSDVLLVIVNLDPHSAHAATTWLDLEALGIPADAPFAAHDELSGATYSWWGPANYVRLDPAYQAAHVLHLHTQS